MILKNFSTKIRKKLFLATQLTQIKQIYTDFYLKK